MLVLSAGSPGSAVGLCLEGAGVGLTSLAGAGDGDESDVCGKACSPAPEVDTGDAPGDGDESGVCGKACSPEPGVDTGDGVGTCARSGHRVAARHPTASKRLFTGTNFLMGILV